MIEPEGRNKDSSPRKLVLLFLAGVAVCAVFFSLGFLVGYNERTSKAASTEAVEGSASIIPPTVNPPTEYVSPSVGDSRKASSSARSADANASDAEPGAAPRPGASSGEVGMGYTIQVAASRHQQDAETLVKILRSRGYTVFLVMPDYSDGRDNLFRVQVGPYTSRDDAEKVRARLALEGFKDLFIKR